jgi:zinc protease
MRLSELIFQGYWPYEHDPIGSMVDLDNAELSWIREFHKAHYAPNNAVLSISGDFDPEVTMGLVRRFFADAKPTQVPPYNPPAVVEQTEARYAEVTDPNAKTLGYYIGWMIPKSREPEHYALELATLILAYGDSSTLYEKLVQGTGQLREVAAWTRDQRGPDSFVIRALLNEDAKLSDIEKEISTELQRLASKGPTEDELKKARQQLQSFFLFGLEGNQSRANQLGSFELFYGDATLLNHEIEHYFKVSPADVQRAVSRYLTKERSNTVVVRPEAATAAKESGN